VGWALSWKRGLEIAQHYRRRYPDRVHILAYEDLIDQPEQTVRALCAFLGQEYNPSLLEVPHVNAAEKEYAVLDGSRGINASRRFRYVGELNPAEIVALRWLCTLSLLRRAYPNLPGVYDRFPLMPRLRAMGLIAAGYVRHPLACALHSRRHGLPLRHYLARRLSVLFRRATDGDAPNPPAAAVTTPAKSS
jgi:hypothetical protein